MQDNFNETKIKRSKKKTIIWLSAMLAVFLLPFLTIATVTFLLPPVYSETFVGELSEKYDRLVSIEDKKLVVIGGSSVAFGLDSEMCERELGMPTVNFGLYANLGTKLMLDLSRANISEGDIIVIAPEMNEQTLSLYFNQDTAMQALDGNFRLLRDIDSENYESLVGASFGFSSDKLGYLLSGEMPKNSGAYSKEYFNEQGDNTYPRPYNVMTAVGRTITLDFCYDGTDEQTSEYEEFIDYLNEYADYAKERGATVYFSFPPMNKASFTDYNTEETIYAFYENLATSLHFRVISNINDYIMDEGYFFDSEFHLNDAGKTVRTAHLIDDLMRESGKTSVTIRDEDLPKPPGYLPIDFEGEDEENLYFILEKAKNGAGQDVYYIVGLNEEGKKQINLKTPSMVDGIPVVLIGEGAFLGSEARTLVLGDNISALVSGSFDGASELRAVYISKTDPNDISTPNNASEDGLATRGARSDLKIYVPDSSLADFRTDYFWGDYTGTIEGYEK